MTITATCGGCDFRWKGHRAAHCAACHQTFSGVALFDDHRQGGRCHDPAMISVKGQPIVRRDTGVWHAPAMSTEVRKELDDVA